MKKFSVTSYNRDTLRVTRYKVKSFLPFSFLLFTFLPVSLLAQKPKPPKHNQNNRKPEIALIENKTVFTGVTFGPTVDWFVPTTTEFDFQREKIKGGFIAGINVDICVVPQRYLYVSTGLLCRYLQGELAFDNLYSIPMDSSIASTIIQRHTTRIYQTMYLTLPTGIKFRTPPTKNCIITGQLGLYHNFRISGKQFDSFVQAPGFFTTTEKIKNKDAALFAEAAYCGIGFEYEFAPKIRAFTNLNYSCQFGYFRSTAINNVSGAQFKAIVHSLHFVFGIAF
jgi:hypothetical protein